jgi:hypothetical protein
LRVLSSFRIGFAASAMLAMFVAAASCGEGGASSDLGSDGGGGPAIPQDARVGDLDATSSAMSTMRIAHLAPEIGPIDFCYQAARTGTFVGPVLRGPRAPVPSTDAGTGDGGDAASVPVNPDANILDADTNPNPNDAEGGASNRSGSYRFVSKYMNLDAAGPITIAIVEGGAVSCANPMVSATVTLDPGKLSTVVLAGRKGADGGAADAPLELSAFTDDRTTAPDKIRVRVIHAALGAGSVAAAGSLGVRAAGSKTTVLTDRVEPRKASTASQAVDVDGLGYVTAAPIPPPASIAIGPASTDGGADAGFDPWQSKAIDLDLRGGSLHTAFVLTGKSATTFEVLWCSDTTTTGDQTTCALIE